MDIFKPFLDQEQVLATYRDGVTAPVKFLPTDRQLYGDSYPYAVTPGHKTAYGGRGCLYAANGNCYFRGDADIIHISPMITQNDHYKAILTGLAKILVKSASDDLKEEIYRYMKFNCKEILDEAENEQVKQVIKQINELDSASYAKLLERLNLHRI